MVYSKAFFDLQLQFADKVEELSGLSFERVLLDYTNLYVRFGLGRDFDARHAIWREYLAGLGETNDEREWTYSFYMKRADATTEPSVVATFGCFSYALLPESRIRLHFQNINAEGNSSLHAAYQGKRRAELSALFEHVQRTQPKHVNVVGASWLYNLEAYRRLFPDSYISTSRVLDNRFRSMPLWGQFLDRHGCVKESMTRPFLERLARQKSLENLHECFPLQVIRVDAPVEEFYAFYGISSEA